MATKLPNDDRKPYVPPPKPATVPVIEPTDPPAPTPKEEDEKN